VGKPVIVTLRDPYGTVVAEASLEWKIDQAEAERLIRDNFPPAMIIAVSAAYTGLLWNLKVTRDA